VLYRCFISAVCGVLYSRGVFVCGLEVCADLVVGGVWVAEVRGGGLGFGGCVC
jgi:hypothetical protein